ncbi:MotA/TolQ/ExbB proton channel family protein [Pelagicoccus sp. SDUM812002]|uniref:MotA/TolQ/ExbB proton channel family protein n=1 Tax=Pelagicoccus sp. SDUM812002 TaxID=3041266 RepID=UPI00280FD686|nr:MotA/TolQ/ExbB proton channel family protein [Pelagicoccus sp. SDUM812002]MDQ8186344.1 MotA/TolQ/ExbB proton channel family protein [Pelagicoccus sp. SDUM812002]
MTPSWVHTVWDTILSGGPIMAALLLLAFLLYRNVIGLFLFTNRLDAKAVFEEQSPDHSRPAIQDFRDHLSQLVSTQLTYANVLIVAAPLLGLLGTVIGMLDTFKGIGAESGQDTTKAVADGVKVALITTQTGLMIAIFGLFLTQLISRLYRAKDLELLELEIQTLQKNISQ